MVGGSRSGSVVHRMKMTYSGGSSSVFRSALNAAVLSIWTSSMMKTFFFPSVGVYAA